MAKKNNPKQKVRVINISKKPKRNRRRVRANMPKSMHPQSGLVHELAHQVCSIVNPFCNQAKGARLPDRDSTDSLTFHNDQILTITADANGAAAIWICASPYQTYYTATTIVGSAVTVWSAVAHSDFYNLHVANIDMARVVSGGLRITSTQAWTTAQGRVIVTETGRINSALLPNLGSLINGVRADQFPLAQCDQTVIMRPWGGANTDYVGMGTVNTSHTALLIQVTGATAGATIGIEHIVNYEYIPALTAAMQPFTGKAAMNNDIVMDTRSVAAAAQALVQSHKGTDEGWMTQAVTSIGQVANTAATAIGAGASAYEKLGPAGRAAIKGASYAMLM